MKKSALLAVLMIATIPAVGLAQEEKAEAPAPTQAPTPEPEPSNWTSSHSITVGAETVAYDAVVGSIILRDDKEKATAELFYTAYFRTNGSDAVEPSVDLRVQRWTGLGFVLAPYGYYGSSPGGDTDRRAAGAASLPPGGQSVHASRPG